MNIAKSDAFLLVSADDILEQLADESVVDLRSHWPIVPILQIDLCHIPPQPKKVQEWTIMQSRSTHRMCSSKESYSL